MFTAHTMFRETPVHLAIFSAIRPIRFQKIMQAEKIGVREAESDRKEKQLAVSDDEMTERYNSLIHTMDKKFKTKKRAKKSNADDSDGETATSSKRRKKKEFLKPSDWPPTSFYFVL